MHDNLTGCIETAQNALEREDVTTALKAIVVALQILNDEIRYQAGQQGKVQERLDKLKQALI